MTGDRRTGMALVATLAIISLVALLTVATLSISTRLRQGSAFALRNARLDAAASFALATPLVEWRQRGMGALGVGASQGFGVGIPRSTISASVMVTRLGAELFWIVAEAAAADDSHRRESFLVRLVVPRADSLPPILASGDVTLSPELTVVRDTVPGCAPNAADLVIGPDALLSSVNGPLPPLTVERSAAAIDSGALASIGGSNVAALAATADRILAAGSEVPAPSGVVHALGDLVITAGTAQGILIVDGQLTIGGPISYSGLIIARGGLVTSAPGAQVIGAIRTGPGPSAGQTPFAITHQFSLRGSACVVQAVVAALVMPRPVGGRRWAEIF